MPFGIVAENMRVRLSAGVALKDEFEILAKAEVKHFVGFIEDDGSEPARNQSVALDVIAQTTRGSNDDMRAFRKLAALEPAVHATDAGDNPCAGILVEPTQLAFDLEGEFARRRNDKRNGRGDLAHLLVFAENRRGDSQAVSDRLAGTGLCGDEDIPRLRFLGQHSGLNRRRVVVIALGERASQRRAGLKKGHGWICLMSGRYRALEHACTERVISTASTGLYASRAFSRSKMTEGRLLSIKAPI